MRVPNWVGSQREEVVRAEENKWRCWVNSGDQVQDAPKGSCPWAVGLWEIPELTKSEEKVQVVVLLYIKGGV